MASAAHSTVTGNGTVSVEALETYTVTATAKGSDGADIGVGGDAFFIRISNQCANNLDTTCTEVVGAEQTIATEIYESMADQNDGTYT